MTVQSRSEEAIFLQALQRRTGPERAAFIDEACAGDEPLKRRVLELLVAHEASQGPLDAPPPGLNVTQDTTLERPGMQIGPYKLLQQIGEGGFGIVFMAEQTEPVRRRVALKVIKPGMDSRQVIARFEAERQALAVMDHANIAKVLDAGTTEGGRPYFVMELVRGTPITQYCDENNLPVRERLELFATVCQAIQHAHTKGIIHRDIKPTNVLVTRQDGQPVVKVIDFGIAKAMGQQLTEKTLFTDFAQMIGTPLYMSPEQAELSSNDIDTRSDVYSLGVLLYELLTGSTPVSKEQLKRAAFDEIRRIIREDEAQRPSNRISTAEAAPSIAAQRHTEPAKLARLVRGELDWIVMKALEKDRSRRYETATGFAADIQHYLNDETVVACPPSALYRFRKFARRSKAAIGVAALVLFFLVLLGSGAGWAVRDRSARDAETARQQAGRQAKVAGQVELIFVEVDRLQREQMWPEALATVRRAEAAVSGGEAAAATAERVRGRLKDLEFIDRLEQIRMERATVVGENVYYAGGMQEYAQAFSEYGVDVEELAVETSIDRLKARPALAMPLAAALDDWVEARQYVSTVDAAGWKRLVAVAHGIDPEPLRDRLRSTWGQLGTPQVQDELRQLADSIDIRAHHPATLVSLARKLTRTDQDSSAIRVLRNAQFVNPGDFWLNFELGNALLMQQDHEGAIRYHTAAVSIRPNSAAAHMHLAISLRGQKKLDEAIVCCHKAIALAPKSSFAYFLLGSALRGQKKWDEAIAAYLKAIALYPTYTDAHMHLGHTLGDQKKWDEAAAWYRKAIEINPKSGPQFLGSVLREQKKWDKAIACYRKWIENDPQYAEAYIQLGTTFEDRKEPDQAIAVYRQALERLPDEARLHLQLAHVLWKQTRLEESAASFRQAIQLNPSGAGYYPYYHLGCVLNQQNKPSEAVDTLRKAIELNPKYAPAHHQLGLALGALGQDADAILCYRKAIQIDPKDPSAYSVLGNALVAQKDFAAAAIAFQEAAALFPNIAAFRNSLGVAHYRAGDFKAAVVALERSRQLNSLYSKDSVTLFFLSMAHGQLNEKEHARTFFDQAAQWRMGIGIGEEELRRLCAEAAALVGLEVPPTLTESPMLTPGPTLLKPAAGATLENGTINGSNLRVWEFDWSDVPGATQHHLYMTGPIAGLWIINDPALTSPHYRYEAKGYVPDQVRLGWRWKVRALVNGIWTDWSEERSFEVAPLDDNQPASPKK